MDESSPLNPDDLIGRFVVDVGVLRITGISARQVMVLLESPEKDRLAAFRIHRVDEQGRMELVGVRAADFFRRDGLLFFRGEVRAARADFEAIKAAGEKCAPPCEVELVLAHVKGDQISHVSAMMFPSACSESVGRWVRTVGLTLGDRVEGGPPAVEWFSQAELDVVLSETMKPVDD